MAKQYLDTTGLTSVVGQIKTYTQETANSAAETAGAAAVGTVLATLATTTKVGVVSTTTQSLAGEKTFTDGIAISSGKDIKIGNAKLTYSTSGSDKILTVSFV